jgi:hypothetical protein
MRIATFVAAGVMLLAATGLAQSVTYDFDRAADFTRFKTYAWTRGNELNDQLNHARVVRSVENQLNAKGLSKVDAGANPDVLVAYHASFDRNLQINAFGTGWAGPRFGGVRSATATTQEILTGTLVIDVLDARSLAIVWRGTATAEIDPSAKPAKREKNISRTAEKLFKSYPPKS